MGKSYFLYLPHLGGGVVWLFTPITPSLCPRMMRWLLFDLSCCHYSTYTAWHISPSYSRDRRKEGLFFFLLKDDTRCRNPTTNGGMQNGSSVGICTRCLHVFCTFGAICMLSQCSLTKFLHRSSVGSLLRVRYIGWEVASLGWLSNTQEGRSRQPCHHSTLPSLLPESWGKRWSIFDTKKNK